MKKNIKLIYKICLSVLSVLTGVLFIVQICSIYNSTPQNPYTVERISQHFNEIAFVFWIWIAAIVGGGVLFAVLKEPQAKPKAYLQSKTTLLKLKQRLPLENALPEAKKEGVLRHILYGVCLALCIASAAVSLSILLDKTYTPQFKGEFFSAHGGAADRLLSIMPWAIAAFLAAVAVCLLAERSRKKEISVLKAELIKNAGKKTEKRKVETISDKIYKKLPFLKSEKWLLGVRIAVCAIGVAFVVWGISNGGMADVLAKAVEICTQCIGLG